MSKLIQIASMMAIMTGQSFRFEPKNSSNKIFNKYNDIKNKPKRNMNENNWIPIEEVNFNDSIVRMTIDTRDFYININDKVKEVYNLDRLLELNSNGKDICIFTINQIEIILKDLYTKSGGKGSWRYLSLINKGKNASLNWNLKYLRINKTIHGYLIYDCQENRVLFKYEITSLIDKEHLNFMEK